MEVGKLYKFYNSKYTESYGPVAKCIGIIKSHNSCELKMQIVLISDNDSYWRIGQIINWVISTEHWVEFQ